MIPEFKDTTAKADETDDEHGRTKPKTGGPDLVSANLTRFQDIICIKYQKHFTGSL